MRWQPKQPNTNKQVVKEFRRKAASQRADISQGQCNMTPNNRDHCSRLSCCYWIKHDPFRCIYYIRNSQCFSLGRITPQNCPFPERPRPHLTHDFFDPPESASKRHLDRLSRFLHDAPVWPTHRHTDKQIDHATCDICGNRRHIQCMRWGLKRKHKRPPITHENKLDLA